jgi:serine-type D-Ala-D-Ala endopeptidase (penicillin-binding protein 7)
MQSSPHKKLRLAALLVALVAAGALVPVAYREWQPAHPPTQVATAPATAPAPPPAPAAAPDQASGEDATPPAPPGAEAVPAEESETDRGPAASSPAGPTLSFGRAAGLHLTPDPLHLSSSAALLVDQDTGEVLASKNDQAVLPIASLTKLMTTLLVLEAHQPMNEVLTITQGDVDTERHSRSRLRPGTSLTREEALHLALMSSENRAAHALARAYPGGLTKMVEAMNAKAKQLGMKNTTYVDPTGLSNRNQSTARDLALLVRTASQNPTMREFSTTPAHLASLGGRTLQYVNSNRLVRNQRTGWDIEMQKTGYIVEAGRCLTMLTKVAGHNLVMVLLDADSNGDRMRDADRMRRWAVAQWGGPDMVAQARAEAPVRQVAAKKKGGGKRKAAVARRDDDDKPVASAKQDASRKKVATRKASGRTQVAKGAGKSAEKEERVRQTFAAARDGHKS